MDTRLTVINFRLLARGLGAAAIGEALTFLPSVGWAVQYGEHWVIPRLLLATAIALAAGGSLFYAGRSAVRDLSQRDALALVALGWFLVGAVGALPYICTGILGPVGAFFESVSGFTTTGASVIDNVEAMPKSILWWRSLTHWLGGLGIAVLFAAVLPYLGAGGKLLFKTESSGPDPRALRPRIRSTALALVKIYVVLTLLQTAALMLTPRMDLFDSLCHAFGTLATGGFSTRQASIAAYDSIAVEAVTILFMLCGATSFALYFNFIHGDYRSLFKSQEWRALIAIWAIASLLVTFNVFSMAPDARATVTLAGGQADPSFAHTLRVSAFSVTSIMTNTGFVTADFDQWPSFSRVLLVVLMCIGGSAGSTSGGIKIVRLLMVLKLLYQRLENTFRPYTIRALRVEDEVINDALKLRVLVFVLAYVICFAVASLVMAAFGLGFDSAASAVATCMSNTGPGLGLVGAVETFSAVPAGGQLFLCFCMILGRLELLTLLVLFVPTFWVSK